LESETDSSVDLAFGFTSQWLDEATGMAHHLNRWFDTALGKWLSDDPMGFAAGDTNVQRYVGNRPLTYVDPTGLFQEMTQQQSIESDSNQGSEGQESEVKTRRFVVDVVEQDIKDVGVSVVDGELQMDDKSLTSAVTVHNHEVTGVVDDNGVIRIKIKLNSHIVVDLGNIREANDRRKAKGIKAVTAAEVLGHEQVHVQNQSGFAGIIKFQTFGKPGFEYVPVPGKGQDLADGVANLVKLNLAKISGEYQHTDYEVEIFGTKIKLIDSPDLEEIRPPVHRPKPVDVPDWVRRKIANEKRR
jgi:RHS repeat-associated protein